MELENPDVIIVPDVQQSVIRHFFLDFRSIPKKKSFSFSFSFLRFSSPSVVIQHAFILFTPYVSWTCLVKYLA